MAQASGLTRLGFKVVGTAVSHEQALELARAERPDVVILDVHLPGVSDGIETGRQIREFLDCKIVFVTGSSDPDTIRSAQSLGPLAILDKPLMPEELANAIQ